jgi:hypothetical protein
MLPNTTASSEKANKRFVQVNPNLEKQLGAYAVAVGATAVAALAAAPPASAEVVYTPVNVTITTSYPLDLNGDGTTDFTIIRCHCVDSHYSVLMLGLDGKGNAVRPPVKAQGGAAALPAGAIIGKSQFFTTQTSYGGVAMAFGFTYGSSTFQGGAWLNANRKYLGLKFLIEGQIHYGWARLDVGSYKRNDKTVTLTGYAYETTSDHLIRAGQTNGADSENASPDDDSTPESTLGALAIGTSRLSTSQK